MTQKILLKRSNVVDSSGNPKLPDSSIMDYGEIAVNYAAGKETLSIKNSNDEIVTFSSDNNSSSGDDSSSIYSITINQDVSDPYKMITSGDSREVIEWIRSNSHRYLGTYVSGDDMMYLCQLDDNDSTKFSDGKTAYLTGEKGDVFMKLPKFYYNVGNTIRNNWIVEFSKEKVGSTWKCWEGNDLIGAFEAIYTDSKLRSIKSTSGDTTTSASTGNISWTTFREYARNTYGSNHGKLVTWEQHCIMAFLYYAYYCNTNCQAQCGSGTGISIKPCGQQLSMIDTTSANGNTKAGINFWGLENWWGNKYEFMDNVSGGSNLFTITTYNGTTGAWGSNRTTTAYSANTYFTHMTIGEYLDVSALDSTSGSSTTGYCDECFNRGSGYIAFRSDNGSKTTGGVACSNVLYSPSDYNSVVGSRLSYVGPWTLLTSNEYMKKINIGVFIQDTEGNRYSISEWDGTKTPNGIAVITYKVRILLALTETTARISNNVYGNLEDYTSGTTDESTAKVDYNGKTNTANIIQFESSKSSAAGWCNSFTFPSGKTKGYLPSLGEWWEIYQNKSAIDAALSACGGTELNTNDYYLSSTFWGVYDTTDARCCWILGWSNGIVSYFRLSDAHYVRAVAALG